MAASAPDKGGAHQSCSKTIPKRSRPTSTRWPSPRGKCSNGGFRSDTCPRRRWSVKSSRACDHTYDTRPWTCMRLFNERGLQRRTFASPRRSSRGFCRTNSRLMKKTRNPVARTRNASRGQIIKYNENELCVRANVTFFDVKQNRELHHLRWEETLATNEYAASRRKKNLTTGTCSFCKSYSSTLSSHRHTHVRRESLSSSPSSSP